jgi:hypothetical protein
MWSSHDVSIQVSSLSFCVSHVHMLIAKNHWVCHLLCGLSCVGNLAHVGNISSWFLGATLITSLVPIVCVLTSGGLSYWVCHLSVGWFMWEIWHMHVLGATLFKSLFPLVCVLAFGGCPCWVHNLPVGWLKFEIFPFLGQTFLKVVSYRVSHLFVGRLMWGIWHLGVLVATLSTSLFAQVCVLASGGLSYWVCHLPVGWPMWEIWHRCVLGNSVFKLGSLGLCASFWLIFPAGYITSLWAGLCGKYVIFESLGQPFLQALLLVGSPIGYVTFLWCWVHNLPVGWLKIEISHI